MLAGSILARALRSAGVTDRFSSMELRAGVRVRVVNQPHDPFEGTLVRPEGGEIIPEGGGQDLVLRKRRVRRNDGIEVVVPEAALQPPE